jgi:hypothetical protein
MKTQEQKIKCPKCGEVISIDTVLTSQIEERIRQGLEKEHEVKEQEMQDKMNQLKKKEQEMDKAKASMDELLAERLSEALIKEKAEIIKVSKIQAAKEKEQEMKMIEDELKEKDKKLQEANAEALELRKERSKLETEKKEFEIKIQRQLDEERAKIQEESSKKATEEQQYIIAQLKKQLTDATKAKDELARKLEQGSQQTQGEVLELELEEILKTGFPMDEILPVPKGVNGADIIQKVYNRSGRLCGQIVWESKKTKNWTEGWIQKLKDDQRAAKADLAVIVSTALPEDTKTFNYRDGIWICDVKLVIALATALHLNLEAITRERAMAVGKNEKMECIYSYLTGTEFRQRVETIVESFSSMKADLEKEKLSIQKNWAKREKQIDRVVSNTIGLYGDLSGLAPLQEIKMLELGEDEDD